MEFPIDKIQGMMAGVALGDTLGAAHEFDTRKPYTGVVQPYVFRSQWQGSVDFPAGIPTDDTQMTLALLRTLIKNRLNYVQDDVILAYMHWANGFPLARRDTEKKLPPMMGINTRKLLGSTVTLNGYQKKKQRLASEGQLISESNGTLMRASPLALANNWQEAVVLDASITNPNPVNIQCNVVYITVMRYLLRGEDAQVTGYLQGVVEDLNFDVKVRMTVAWALVPDSIQGYFVATGQKSFSEKATKGWVINALYVSLRVVYSFSSFDDAMTAIITNPAYGGPGSDTDTLGAIAGALIGARLGFSRVTSSPAMKHNWEQVLIAPSLQMQRPVWSDYSDFKSLGLSF